MGVTHKFFPKLELLYEGSWMVFICTHPLCKAFWAGSVHKTHFFPYVEIQVYSRSGASINQTFDHLVVEVLILCQEVTLLKAYGDR